MRYADEYIILDQALKRGREKVQVLWDLNDVEVDVRSGKLTRNSNPSFTFYFEGTNVSAQLGFWSGSMTGEVLAGNKQNLETIEGYGYTLSNVAEIDEHFDRIISIYLERVSEK